MSNPYLESARLRFFRPGPNDVVAIETLLRGRGAPDPAGTARSIVERWENRPYGTLLVRLRTTGELVGLGGIKDVLVDGAQVPDFGFQLEPAHQRQGLGGEAGDAILLHAFLKLGLARVVANTTDDNEPALQLLARWRFSYLRRVVLDGRDSQLWELSRDAYDRSCLPPFL